MKTLHEILGEARQFITGETSSDFNFPHDFHFAPTGRPAYELVIDASGSMDGDDYPPTRFEAAKQAAKGFVDKCVAQTPEALVGVIFYSHSAIIASPLVPVRANSRHIHRAIVSGDIATLTSIGDGLAAAGKEFMAKGASLSPTIVLLTDGHSNEGPEPIPIASRLKGMGVRLDIIGIGGSPSDVNEAELKQMASVLNGQLRYWFIRDTPTLIRKFEALALGKV